MKKVLLFILSPILFLFKIFFNFLYVIFSFIKGLFFIITNKENLYLNKTFDLDFEEFKDGKFIKKQMEFLPDNYYKITEYFNIIGLQINESIYEYKIKGDLILSRAISIKEGGKYKIKDNTVLISDIKEKHKKNKFISEKEGNKEISILKNKCMWHQEDDCYIKSTLYMLILKKPVQFIRNIIRKDLEKYKLIKFEFDELLESFGAKYQYNKKEELYEFIGVNKNISDIPKKDIKYTFNKIEKKYGINPTQLNNKIKKIDDCIKNFLK